MEIRFSKLALKQRDLIKKSGDLSIQKKISLFLREIINDPYSGLDHPKRLKGYETPTYRRKNRFVYSYLEEESIIEVLSIWGHYDDR